MNKTLVSVIMSCYNETEHDLQDSIESILNQSYRYFEFIIVNDNPDNAILKKILNKYRLSDIRIKIINNSVNIGLSESLNKAISLSKGIYIARMDADDISYPNRLEKQIEYLKLNPNCDLVSTNRDDIDEESKIIKKASGIIVNDEAIPLILKYGSIITHPSVMIKASVIKSLGGYRSFKSSQDYDLWLRMVSLNCKFHIISEPLIKYRIRANSITNANFAKSYFELKYIRKLFFERKKNSNKDSYSETAFNLMTQHNQKKHFVINNQFSQLNQLKKNIYNPILLAKIIYGIITNFDCFNNIKNLLLTKIIIIFANIKNICK